VSRSHAWLCGRGFGKPRQQAALHAARANRQQIFARDFSEALDKIILGTARG
jgi:ATP-dependent 26S proteasome regulatory subunit